MPGAVRERAHLRVDAHREPGEGPVPRHHHLPHLQGLQGGRPAGKRPRHMLHFLPINLNLPAFYLSLKWDSFQRLR